MIKRNAERQQRRAAGIEAEPDELIPQAPTVPDDFEPFTPEQREAIAEYTEAFNHYSRALQYTLTKVTKGYPYRFVVQCNYNNSSGFETWRRLHITYDHGEKTQQLGHTITYHKTELEQHNTITKRVRSTLPELARRGLQLRDYSADRDSYIYENGSTHAVHSRRHQITSTIDAELGDSEI
eukprot:166491-Amphidinium_carterae.1